MFPALVQVLPFMLLAMPVVVALPRVNLAPPIVLLATAVAL